MEVVGLTEIVLPLASESIIVPRTCTVCVCVCVCVFFA